MVLAFTRSRSQFARLARRYMPPVLLSRIAIPSETDVARLLQNLAHEQPGGLSPGEAPATSPSHTSQASGIEPLGDLSTLQTRLAELGSNRPLAWPS